VTTRSHEAPVCCFSHPRAVSWPDGSGGGKAHLKCKWRHVQTQRGVRTGTLRGREATSWTYHFLLIHLFLRQKGTFIPLMKVYPNEKNGVKASEVCLWLAGRGEGKVRPTDHVVTITIFCFWDLFWWSQTTH